MAIYRKGQASMDAQGYITGYDTNWREQLSLIRPGATILFIDPPFQAAVISEVISDTAIRAITTGGAEVARGNYIILLHDSITVDGLAQDVAETLRYYQSKETQIEEAIEFFKNFDLKTLQDLVNQIKDSEKNTSADRVATEQLKNETNQIKADTNAIKTQTQQIKDSAVTEIGEIRNDALDARDAAENAQFAAEQSNVAAANAKQGAETARDEARQWAQQVNPENILHKDQNLNDLANKDLAREALKVEAVNSVKGQNPGDYNSFRNPAWTYELRISNNGEWRVAKNSDGSTSALSIAGGGTGASTFEEARKNFHLQGVFCVTSETPGDFNALKSPDGKLNMLIANNGVWGVQDDLGNIKPLPLERGGTGAQSIGQARSNFGIGETDIPVFRGISLTEKNSANSGILYLLNKNAEGVQISYSRIYNEIQGGLAKATIQVTREGGDTNYYQFDESGNARNYNSITIGRGIGNAFGDNSLVIGDTDTGLRWSSDGVIQAVSNSQNIFAWTPFDFSLYKKINSFAPEDSAAVFINGTRAGGPASCLIGGEVGGGAFSGWRDRAAGMLVEVPGSDVAVNIVKAVQWGAAWIFGIDVARYGAGGCEAHLNVKGTSYTFNDAGYASAVQWVNTSDIRLKANLKEIKSAKDKVKSIKGYTYFKRNSLEEDENSFYSEEAGVIAQDVQTVLPEAVYKISDSEVLGVSYGGVTALLVNAINEMIDDSDKQNESIARLHEEIDNLKAEIEGLKTLIKAFK